MKKGLAIICISLCFTMIGFALHYSNPLAEAAEKVITLKMVTYLPPYDRHIKHHLEGKDMIEKATDGRVRLEIYHSASICKGPEEWDFVNRGVADLSVSYVGYQSASMPLLGLDTLPVWKHFVGNRKAWPELMPLFDEEYRAHGLKNLVTLCAKFSGGRYIGTKKKQVKVPADLKGLKIRESGALEQRSVELCGGTNVYITGAEIYEALQRGIVDGSYGCPVNWVDWKWVETIDYLLNLCVGQTSVHVLANKNSLAKLSQRDREVVTYILQNQCDLATREVVEYEDYFLHYEIPKHVTVYTPSDEEEAIWVKTLSPIIDEWLKQAGSRGQRALDIVKKYN